MKKKPQIGSKITPQLAAVEVELAADRGELSADDPYQVPEVVDLRARPTNLDNLIDKACVEENKKDRHLMRRPARLSFPLLLSRLTFGLYTPPKAPPKDYTYEYDPRTGGYRRHYVLSDKDLRRKR